MKNRGARMMVSCATSVIGWMAALTISLAAPRATAADSVASMSDGLFNAYHDRYTQLCANCHGPDWMGGQGGSLVDGKWRKGGKPDELFRSIKSGYDQSGMPAFGATLTDTEINGFVDYLYEAGRRHAALQHTKAEAPPDGARFGARVDFLIETVAGGLNTPWSLAWLPDGRMLVTERPGGLRIIGPEGQVSDPIIGTPSVFARNQGGMLDVAAHPDHIENGWIYLSYSQPRQVRRKTVAFTAIARGRIRDGHWVDHEIVFEVPEEFYNSSEKHWGCKLVFDRSGHLFFGIGERGHGPNAQDLAHPAGKIHRIHDDGRIPADNPFADEAETFPSIWAYGVRNPQGLARDPRTGRLFETEHGPRGGDEFNLIEPGKNYGWPIVSRGRNYDFTPARWERSRADVAEPLLDWTPSIAASGLAFYDGVAFPGWRGSFLAGGLVKEQLELVSVSRSGTATSETILKGIGRVRDVRVGPDGFVYLAINHRTREGAGRIVRLRPVE